MAVRDREDSRRFRLPAILLGVSLGGFFDGIVIHQVLQWHHLLSVPYPPDSVSNLELNTLADGLFHLAAWFVAVAGVFVLWAEMRQSQTRPTWGVLFGGLLAGWGGFNVIEGLIDHQILGIHHVRPGPDWLAWDIGYLAVSAAMLAVGIVLSRAPSGDRLR
jgi:uncharacterized membrane protein